MSKTDVTAYIKTRSLKGLGDIHLPGVPKKIDPRKTLKWQNMS